MRYQRTLLCVRALVALVAILASGAALGLPQVDARSNAADNRVLALRHGAADFAGCQLQNANAAPEGLTLGSDLSFRSAAYGSDRRFGICVSQPIEAPADFD